MRDAPAPRISIWLAGAAGRRHFDPARLSAGDAARYRSLRSDARREGFAVSRALQQALDLPPTAVQTLSHSGSYAAIAATSGEVCIGIDIEQHRPRDLLALARFAFHPDETAALEAAAPERRARAFYTRWVMKEALAKALQIPLLEAARECSFIEREGRWMGRAPCTSPWRIRACEPATDLSLAVAVVGPGCEADMASWEWPPLRPAQWPMAANFFWPSDGAGTSTLLAESSTCRDVLPTS